MAQATKEPCKKEACDIQACLSKNNFLPQKYALLTNYLSACLTSLFLFVSQTSKPLDEMLITSRDRIDIKILKSLLVVQGNITWRFKSQLDNPSLNDATGGAYLHFYVCHLSHVLVGVWGLSIAIQVFVCIVVWLTKFIPSLDVTNLVGMWGLCTELVLSSFLSSWKPCKPLHFLLFLIPTMLYLSLGPSGSTLLGALKSLSCWIPAVPNAIIIQLTALPSPDF
ncbi:hypothetical protein V8G54_015983 [Vigna mungo]|uniref:Uncharacterized protein n=1 Tax=Vigna mungo TaxID=3915 RepID=A0AAQ3NN81_VIGMU